MSVETAKPPLSVIVPVFNGEDRLPKMLSSLCTQTYDQALIEIIVVDDHSTDASVSVSRSFGARIVENGTKNPGTRQVFGNRGCDARAPALFGR